MSRRTKTESNARRSLLTIVDEIRETFRSDNSNIIRRGDLLIEAKAQVEHGEWLPWLKSYFDMSEDTAERLMSVARLADKFRILRNMDLSHLPKGVLYALASEDYSDAVIKAVLVEAESAPINIDRLDEIDEELNPPEPEPVEDLPETDWLKEQQEPETDWLKEQQEAEAEAEKILDGPPPDLPPIAEITAPTDFTLAQFDKAVKALSELHTKSVGKFIGTGHSTDDLEKAADFLRAVANALHKQIILARDSVADCNAPANNDSIPF
jgi:hypothetical protein